MDLPFKYRENNQERNMTPKNILLVVDEVESIPIYSDLFKINKNIQVQSARDGNDACGMSRAQKFDLIVSDFKLPKINSEQLIKALRDNIFNNQTPIIFVTVFPEKVVTELKEGNFFKNITFITKPIESKSLKEMVKKILMESSISKKKSVDVEFLNPYLFAVQKIFREKGKISNIEFGKVELFSEEQLLKTDISSSLTLTSSHFKGTFVLAYPKKTYLKIVTSCLGKYFVEINDENKEFAGELSNIIMNESKKIWQEKGYIMEKLIPHTQIRSNIDIEIDGAIPNIIIPFDSDFGKFYSMISIVWD